MRWFYYWSLIYSILLYKTFGYLTNYIVLFFILYDIIRYFYKKTFNSWSCNPYIYTPGDLIITEHDIVLNFKNIILLIIILKFVRLILLTQFVITIICIILTLVFRLDLEYFLKTGFKNNFTILFIEKPFKLSLILILSYKSKNKTLNYSRILTNLIFIKVWGWSRQTVNKSLTLFNFFLNWNFNTKLLSVKNFISFCINETYQDLDDVLKILKK